MSRYSDLPNIGAPATRALWHEGIYTLKELASYTKDEVTAFHGVGPKAMSILTREMKKKGLSFIKISHGHI